MLKLPGVVRRPPAPCVPIVSDWGDEDRSTRVRAKGQVIKSDLPDEAVAGLMHEAARERRVSKSPAPHTPPVHSIINRLQEEALKSSDDIKVVKKEDGEESTTQFEVGAEERMLNEHNAIERKELERELNRSFSGDHPTDEVEADNRRFDGLRIAGFPVMVVVFCAIMVSLTVGIIFQMMRSGEESAAVVRTAQVAAVQRFAPKVVIVPQVTPLMVPAPAKQPQKQAANSVEPPKMAKQPRAGRHMTRTWISKSEVDHNL
jgi:hypothetical protein